jgi:hypothetical protein
MSDITLVQCGCDCHWIDGYDKMGCEQCIKVHYPELQTVTNEYQQRREYADLVEQRRINEEAIHGKPKRQVKRGILSFLFGLFVGDMLR